MKIVVAGCVAQAEGDEIVRRADMVDVVVGPQSYHHLPELLKRAGDQGRAIETEFPAADKFGFLAQPNGPTASESPSALDRWVVRDVRRGAALIEGRMGLIEVVRGDVVPGLGRVAAIGKHDGRWIVITTKGLITSTR